MEIYINNQLAALKQRTSFEYISENRLFSGSDGYTLTITFPLKDCPQNQAIFGHINRADVAAQKVIFDCEIRCKPRGLPSSLVQARGAARIGDSQIRDKGFYKFGCITITEINEAEGKGRGKRADHDTLPDSIKALYVENLSLLQRMRELHLKFRSLSLENVTCPDSERYPFLKEIIKLDKKLHSNWI